jgi:hypothetical protein
MSVVGIVVTVGTMAVLVAFALAIARGNAVGLIAGYQQGDLPPEKETELARDVRNLLLVVTLSLVPLLVHFAVRELPAAVHTGLPTVVLVVLLAWLLWKWNLGQST